MKFRKDILIVDDDEDMLDVVEHLLRSRGYDTRTASNGLQALEVVAEAMPSLILLDMLMPVMDGWQFAQEFHARYDGGAPIVVLTAAEHPGSMRSELDVDDVLTKPFDIGRLLDVIAQHMESP